MSSATDSTPEGIESDLNCGFLNAISAIVYFFVPSIIAFSMSKKKDFVILESNPFSDCS